MPFSCPPSLTYSSGRWRSVCGQNGQPGCPHTPSCSPSPAGSPSTHCRDFFRTRWKLLCAFSPSTFSPIPPDCCDQRPSDSPPPFFLSSSPQHPSSFAQQRSSFGCQWPSFTSFICDPSLHCFSY